MSAESPKPPPFYCPACGKKHRADLSAIQRAPGAVAKVTCARCAAVMSLHIGDDGLPKCELPDHAETHAGSEAATAPSSLGLGLPSGGAMSKPSLLAPVLAAVIAAAMIAAIVTFFVAQSVGGDAPPAAAGTDVGTLQQTVENLRGQLASMQERLEGLEAEAAHARSDIDARLQVVTDGAAQLGARVSVMADEHAVMKTTMASATAATQDYNGRIEANYTNLRVLTKRLEKLEKE